ncbi:hypothetical protein MMC28_004099 [Mycoblastus sanguinarius]|nr:hypothetical protein [Mycoblastus sanguinarius]
MSLSQGTKALYTVTVQAPESTANVTEIRVLDLLSEKSTLFSNDAGDKEAKWLGRSNQVVWLKEVGFGVTEIWIGDAEGRGQDSHCAGRIGARISHLKLQELRNEYDDIAIAVACLTTSNGALHNPEQFNASPSPHPPSPTPDGEIANAIWYNNLRKKAMRNSRPSDLEYIISPTRFVNALRGTVLESPIPGSIRSTHDFDISTSDSSNVNVYYIPLKTFTEASIPRPQIINVTWFGGSSICPVFCPDGNSVAFLKKQHPRDQNDRNRVIVINNIRDFCAHMAIDTMHTRPSEKDWHLSPYSVAWSGDGKELYVVAVEARIRKLFKIPATLSSIKVAPEPITSASTTPADLRHLRMVFSAPMDASCTTHTAG